MAIEGPAQTQTAREKLQILVMALVVMPIFVVSLMIPFLSYLALAYGAYKLITSLPKWNHLANPEHVAENMALGFSTNFGIGAAVVAAYAFLPLGNFIFLTGLGAALAYAYTKFAIIELQQDLDEALLKAAGDSHLAKINTLLARGANPYAANEAGNNAFHLAVRRHANAKDVLEALKNHKPQNISLSDAFAPIRNISLRDAGKMAKVLFDAMLAQRKEYDLSKLKAPAQRLFEYFTQPLGTAFDLYAQHARRQLAPVEDINAINKAGKSAFDFVSALEVGEENVPLFEKMFTDMGARRSAAAEKPVPQHFEKEQSAKASDKPLAPSADAQHDNPLAFSGNGRTSRPY